MQTLYEILGLIGAGLILFFIYQSIKGRPELYSKENLSRSFFTMGLLALILIVFIAFLVLMLRSA